MPHSYNLGCWLDALNKTLDMGPVLDASEGELSTTLKRLSWVLDASVSTSGRIAHTEHLGAELARRLARLGCDMTGFDSVWFSAEPLGPNDGAVMAGEVARAFSAGDAPEATREAIRAVGLWWYQLGEERHSAKFREWYENGAAIEATSTTGYGADLQALLGALAAVTESPFHPLRQTRQALLASLIGLLPGTRAIAEEIAEARKGRFALPDAAWSRVLRVSEAVLAAVFAAHLGYSRDKAKEATRTALEVLWSVECDAVEASQKESEKAPLPAPGHCEISASKGACDECGAPGHFSACPGCGERYCQRCAERPYEFCACVDDAKESEPK